MTLDNVSIGNKAKIVALSPAEAGFRRKLLSLGVTPGTEVYVKRSAPLGDPLQIEVRGFTLSLRKAEAKTIQVEQTDTV